MKNKLIRISLMIFFLFIFFNNYFLIAQNISVPSTSNYDDSLFVFSKEATVIYGVPKENVVDKQPNLTNQREIKELLQYPESTKEKKIEGTIVLRFIIDSKGNVNHIELIKGLNTELNEVAINAAKQMKYEPGLKDGKPVPVIISMPFQFKL